jgi:hypothetical protein
MYQLLTASGGKMGVSLTYSQVPACKMLKQGPQNIINFIYGLTEEAACSSPYSVECYEA